MSESDASVLDSEDEARRAKALAKGKGKGKRARATSSGEEEQEDSDGSDDYSSDGDAGFSTGSEADEEEQFTFEFCDPKPSNFHSLRMLLQRYLVLAGEGFAVSSMANAVADQAEVGTMIEQEGEPDDVFAFATVLNMAEHRGLESMGQVRGFLLERCPPELRARLEAVLDSGGGGGSGGAKKGKKDKEKKKKKQGSASSSSSSSSGGGGLPAGLLLTERMMNLPAQLVPPMHAELVKDIAWASSEEARREVVAEGRAPLGDFGFSSYVLIGRRYVEKKQLKALQEAAGGAAGAGGSKGGKKAKKAKADSAGGSGGAAAAGSGLAGLRDEDWIYCRFEDEVFLRHADLSFAFNVPAPNGQPHREYQQYAVVVDAAKMPVVLQGIDKLLETGSVDA